MDSIVFELTKKFNYAAKSGGREAECTFIELREPTGEVSHICCAIEGLIQTGVLKMSELLGEDIIEQAKEAAQDAKAVEVEDEGEKDADGVLALMVGGGVDMSRIVLHFRELFRKVGWMEGEKQLTPARMDEMSHTDFRKMLGVYAANFILN